MRRLLYVTGLLTVMSLAARSVSAEGRTAPEPIDLMNGSTIAAAQMQIAQALPPPPVFYPPFGPAPQPGRHFGPDDDCGRPPHEHGFDGPPPDHFEAGFDDAPGQGLRDPAMMVAGHFAAMETLIGIRSDQLDAWRAFTSAALAMMPPPPIDFRMRASQVPGTPDGPGAGQPNTKVVAQAKEPDAFAIAEHMADQAIAHGENAKTLKQAILTLRQKLTPEQLARVEGEMLEHFKHGHPFRPRPDGGPNLCSGVGMTPPPPPDSPEKAQ